MIVEELIKALQSENPKAVVIVRSSNPEHCGSLITLDSITQLTGKPYRKVFRDSLDGQPYNLDTWSTLFGDEPLILI